MPIDCWTHCCHTLSVYKKNAVSIKYNKAKHNDTGMPVLCCLLYLLPLFSILCKIQISKISETRRGLNDAAQHHKAVSAALFMDGLALLKHFSSKA